MKADERFEPIERVEFPAPVEAWRAVHRVTRRPVRLLIIRSHDVDAQRFVGTWRRLATLTHANLPAVLDADVHEDETWFAVEEPGSESALLRISEGRATPADLIRWSRALLSGIRAAHEAGILHGSLAPARLRIGSAGLAQVDGFGLPSILRSSDGRTVAIDTESSPYLPLRVLRNPRSYDAESDRIAAAGVVIHLLGGEPPDGNALGERGLFAHAPHGLVEALERLLSPGHPIDAIVPVIDALDAWVSPLWRPTRAVRTPNSSATPASYDVVAEAVRAAGMTAPTTDSFPTSSEEGDTPPPLDWDIADRVIEKLARYSALFKSEP
jgi:serine/threonine protein kinase